MPTTFGELTGGLTAASALPVGRKGRVELSCIGSGFAYSPARATVSLKYAAAGTEVYRYAGRIHRVPAGSFLLLPEGNEGEALIDRRDGIAMGMCVFLPARLRPAPVQRRVEAPLVFPADASTLGRLLISVHRSMRHAPQAAPSLARRLLLAVDAQLEPLIIDATRQLESIAGAKPMTRYDTLRRLNLARAYLHSIVDRPVELAELAVQAGVSRFQLARDFATCFGAPPGAYHRRLRLERARDLLVAHKISCTEAAVRFGFSDLAHFSRAYRQAFGNPPSEDQRPTRCFSQS